MQGYLHSDRFDYDIDLTDVECDTASAGRVLRPRRSAGYCLHFASAMAILLRQAIPDHPIPTRLVQGFLPGEADGRNDDRPHPRRPRVGRGLLPELRLDPVRPDGRRSASRRASPAGVPVAPPSAPPLPAFSFEPPDPAWDPGPRRGATADRVPPVAAAAGPRGADDGRGPARPDHPRAGGGRLAARPARRGQPRRRVEDDGPHRVAVRVRATAHPDGLRVRDHARRPRPGGGTRHPGDRERQGRDELRPREAGRGRLDAVKDATRRLRISLLRLVFRRPRRRRRA